MSKVLGALDARSAFVAGLSAGVLVASAAFLVYRGVAAPDVAATMPMPGTRVATGPWHDATAQGNLAGAIQASLRLLPATSAAQPAATRAAPTSSGGDGELLARADVHRRKREFGPACDLYAEVAARGGMTADAWADYADAKASLAGRLAGEPAHHIAAALAIDPGHPKALWLQASLAHEEHRYADALAVWRRLLAIVPPGSSDARIIAANIAEAERLARG